MHKTHLWRGFVQHGHGLIHDPRAVRCVTGDTNNRRPGVCHTDHDFPDGFSGVFIRLPKEKTGSVNNMFGKRELDNGQMVLITVCFGLIENFPHEIEPRIGPHSAKYADGAGICLHGIFLFLN